MGEARSAWAIERERDEARAEVERLKRIIRADHDIKAAQGGAPCICEFCRGEPDG